jgi:Neprosin
MVRWRASTVRMRSWRRGGWRALSLGTLLVLVALGVITPSATSGAAAPSGAYYFYNVMSQSAGAAGAAVSLSQARPRLGAQGRHSLTELAVSSADQSDAIEFGWTVDKSINGDALPHLFVYHWVNFRPTCYNACGFVPLSKRVHVGMAVQIGHMGRYAIQFKNHRWLLTYNGLTVGYFPESLWKNQFARIGEAQAFGEVLSSSPNKPDTQMGNGVLGTKPHAAAIEHFELIGGNSKKPFSYLQAAPGVYRIHPDNRQCTSSCGMTFGGPGY